LAFASFLPAPTPILPGLRKIFQQRYLDIQ
jgi:hypothetical protein